MVSQRPPPSLISASESELKFHFGHPFIAYHLRRPRVPLHRRPNGCTDKHRDSTMHYMRVGDHEPRRNRHQKAADATGLRRFCSAAVGHRPVIKEEAGTGGGLLTSAWQSGKEFGKKAWGLLPRTGLCFRHGSAKLHGTCNTAGKIPMKVPSKA